MENEDSIKKSKLEKISKNPVVVIGLGEIGRPLLEIVRQKRSAIGIDTEPNDLSAQASIMHICFPCQIEDFIGTSVGYINRYNPDLTILNSTVVPGTTRAIYEKIGKPIAYSPIRGKHFKMKQDLLFYAKFVAGIDDKTAHLAEEHFKGIGMKTKVFSSLEGLELAKLLSTTYFGLLIAWAQEVERVCKRYNADYDEVMSFTEEIDYFPPVIFKPGCIGGHCIISNVYLLKKIMESDFLAAILRSNEKKAKELVDQGKSLGERLSPRKIK